ncbi:MAG: PEP-CTERM sorting domain-containing protein [Pirellulales bacterium]
MTRTSLYFALLALAVSPAYAAVIIDLTASAYTDHHLGSSLGHSEVDSAQNTLSSHLYAEAITDTPEWNAYARATASAQAHIYAGGAGFIRMKTSAATPNSYSFPNSPAVTSVNGSIQLDFRREAYSFIAKGDGNLFLDQSAMAIMRPYQDLSISRFVGAADVTREFAAIWYLTGAPVPGGTPAFPLPGNPPAGPLANDPISPEDAYHDLFADNPPAPDEDESVVPPTEVTGAFLKPIIISSPVLALYGTENSIYFSGSPELETPSAASLVRAAADPKEIELFGLDSDSPLSSDYYFLASVNNPRFKSFALADLDPISTFTISFAGTTRQVAGGEVVDFTSVDPEGILGFLVSGLSDGANDGAGIPHVFGMTFASEGVAEFAVARVVPVPEPASISVLLAGLGVFAGTRTRFLGRRSGK